LNPTPRGSLALAQIGGNACDRGHDRIRPEIGLFPNIDPRKFGGLIKFGVESNFLWNHEVILTASRGML